MHVFEMVVWVVAIGVIGGILTEHMRQKRKATESGMNDGAHKKIAELEERVKVLERLATDKRSRLADEIDNL